MPHAFRTLKRCKSVDFAFSGYFAILRHWTPVSSSLCINSWYQINSISGQRISKPLTNLPAIWELVESPNLALAIWSSGSSKAKRRWSGPPTRSTSIYGEPCQSPWKKRASQTSRVSNSFSFSCVTTEFENKTLKKVPRKSALTKTRLWCHFF